MKKQDKPIRSICVYCGSRPGAAPEYMRAGKALGLTQANVGAVIGRDRTSLRRGIDPDSKAGELAALLTADAPLVERVEALLLRADDAAQGGGADNLGVVALQG